MGRKDRYESHVKPFLKKITELIQTETEKSVAAELGVSQKTFEKYKAEHEELRDAINKGLRCRKTEKIKRLKSMLEKRAEGFKYTETKKIIRNVDGVKTQVLEEYEKYSPPDVGAIHLLLKNLDDEWTNDDKKTLDLKKEKVELEKMRLEMNDW